MPTILLVDDEPEILAALRAALTRGLPDVRVLTASGAKAGLAFLDGERVDIVVSDHMMPGMSGLDLLVEARQRSPKAARVMLTAFPDDQMAIRAINEARLDYFFVKPVKLADFVGRLKAILGAAARADHSKLAFARTFDALRRQTEGVQRERIGARKYPAPFTGPLSGDAVGRAGPNE